MPANATADPETTPAPWEEASPGLEGRTLPDSGEPEPGWPAPLGEAALHRLAGEAVRRLLPLTEADPAGPRPYPWYPTPAACRVPIRNLGDPDRVPCRCREPGYRGP